MADMMRGGRCLDDCECAVYILTKLGGGDLTQSPVFVRKGGGGGASPNLVLSLYHQ